MMYEYNLSKLKNNKFKAVQYTKEMSNDDYESPYNYMSIYSAFPDYIRKIYFNEETKCVHGHTFECFEFEMNIGDWGVGIADTFLVFSDERFRELFEVDKEKHYGGEW